MQKHVLHSFNPTACRQISDESRDSVRARPAAHPRTFGLLRRTNTKRCQTLDRRTLNGCPFLIQLSLFPVTDCALEEKSIRRRGSERYCTRPWQCQCNLLPILMSHVNSFWPCTGRQYGQTMRCEDLCWCLQQWANRTVTHHLLGNLHWLTKKSICMYRVVTRKGFRRGINLSFHTKRRI